MTAVELLPSLHALPRSEKLQLIQLLAADLAREEAAQPSQGIVLLPADQCPYSPAELASMRNEAGGRTLVEIRQSRGIL